MATIGLDNLYYAAITEDIDGMETYGTPTKMAGAVSVELSIELNEGNFYSDDNLSAAVKEFKSGSITLAVDDIGSSVASVLVGASVDDNGVLIHAGEDSASPVAVGFRAKMPNGKYRYFWLYRVLFGVPSTSLATKGDSITFSNPSIAGVIMLRNKADLEGKHPWKSEITEGETEADATTIASWFTEVYEPSYTNGDV